MGKEELSAAEVLIMKAIWSAHGELSITDLMDIMREEYGKDYARTSMATFLLRLSDKRFVRTERKGRNAYIYALVSEEEYRREVAKRDTSFWFKGKAVDYLASLHEGGDLSDEAIKQIREYLDELEN